MSNPDGTKQIRIQLEKTNLHSDVTLLSGVEAIPFRRHLVLLSKSEMVRRRAGKGRRSGFENNGAGFHSSNTKPKPFQMYLQAVETHRLELLTVNGIVNETVRQREIIKQTRAK